MRGEGSLVFFQTSFAWGSEKPTGTPQSVDSASHLSGVVRVRKRVFLCCSPRRTGILADATDLACAIEADGLEIFVGVNPAFFAINADFDPEIVANAQPDAVLSFFPRHQDLAGENVDL